MAPIVKLAREIADRIAAGEVVERPASIIKELLENSLDAGASHINIEMEDGGCRLLRVSDNGAGIAAEELPLALARHATSKISTFEDIYHINSFGFRGEALASIASVAHVEVISKPASALSASCIIADNGKVLTPEPCGAPVGTTVTVSGIFDALPARKKFLKTAATELGYSLEAIARIAVSATATRIQVHNNGKEVAFYPACADLGARASAVLGGAFTEDMLKLAADTGEIAFMGLVSSPVKSAANSRSIYIFVNGRFVKDYLINHAVISAYRRLIEPKRYPLGLLFITVHPAEVDVNVHPAKLEVRFRYPRAVYDVVAAALSRALSNTAQPISENASGLMTETAAEYKKRVEEALSRYTASYAEQQTSSAMGYFLNEERKGYGRELAPASARSIHLFPPATELFARALKDYEAESADVVGSAEQDASSQLGFLRYLGAIQAAYLLFEEKDGLLIVDQHAAHERIIFEKLKAAAASGKIAAQELITPEVITLSARETTVLATAREDMAALGFLIEPFGANTFIVKGLPCVLASALPSELIRDIIDEIVSVAGKPSVDEWRERVLIRLACTNAVKARETLSEKEVMELVDSIKKLGMQLTCPHGRPILMRFSLTDLGKMFRRK